MTITASCGHAVQSPDDLVPVEYASETCDAVEGFLPVTVYAVFCPECASALQGADNMIEITDADRRAAQSILWVSTAIDDQDAIAQAFAAHREAAVRDMRERAANEAEDFWGVDSAADRIRALPLGSK